MQFLWFFSIWFSPTQPSFLCSSMRCALNNSFQTKITKYLADSYLKSDFRRPSLLRSRKQRKPHRWRKRHQRRPPWWVLPAFTIYLCSDVSIMLRVGGRCIKLVVFLVQLACLLNSHFIILIQKNNLRKLARIWLEDWEKWKIQLQRSYNNEENNDTNLKESKYSLWIKYF